MKLFKNQSRYPDLSKGFETYRNRSKNTPEERIFDEVQYNRIVKKYCKMLSEVLQNEGIVDLPSDIGSIAAVSIKRKPLYNRKTKMFMTNDYIDWNETRKTGRIVRDDNPNTFGFVFVPKHIKGHENFRCFGIRANKTLYQRMRKHYDTGTFDFYLADINTYQV